ncbi:MAG: serine protease [Armatimonadota bacterium]|nr:serine protease [Armatimonadota bacterium]MDR7451733.1 serine protease [Armatimonadota bacterium]MDR7467358.1 serine protease [Armatimonadota bacterium]MDR7494128.1 serine protease [Armatimonadota bacterium]MDR7498906.1 serine protease [Armatimonadota bacterium]
MRTLTLILIVGLLASPVPLYAQDPAPPYLEAKRGVVLIDTGGATGTGFVVSPSLVVTACHVVRGAAAIQIRFWSSGRQASGRLVLCHERHDVGVIAAAVPDGVRTLQFAERTPAQGDRVWVWGYPLGTRIAAEPTLAAGIISASGTAEGTFVVDVSGGPGSSGGPVLDEDGKVVGILLGAWTDGRQGSTGFKHAVASPAVTPLLAGVASAAPSADGASVVTAEQTAILPGRGIGSVRLGMTPAQVEAALGVPPSRRLESGWAEWQGRSLWIYFAAGRAAMIDTEDRAAATPEGIRVGSTDADLIRAYGTPACSSVRDYRGQAYLGWYYSGLFVFLKGSPRQVFGLRVIDAAAAGVVCR